MTNSRIVTCSSRQNQTTVELSLIHEDKAKQEHSSSKTTAVMLYTPGRNEVAKVKVVWADSGERIKGFSLLWWEVIQTVWSHHVDTTSERDSMHPVSMHLGIGKTQKWDWIVYGVRSGIGLFHGVRSGIRSFHGVRSGIRLFHGGQKWDWIISWCQKWD